MAPDHASAGRVRVLLPLPLPPYDYRRPAGLALAPGAFVRVPLGRREAVGVVWDGPPGDVAESRLKDVIDRLDAPLLPATARRFVDWVAGYTVSPAGNVLKMVMSVPDALNPPRPVAAWRAGPDAAARAEATGLRLTAARQRVLAAADGPPRPQGDLARQAGVSPGVVKALAEAGVLERVDLPADPGPGLPDLQRPGPALSPSQSEAAADLAARVVAGGFSAVLLDGVTGSGKTEVYFEAIAAALAQDRQCLVLLPEIALSAEWLARFDQRFGARPVAWHSELGPGERRRTWRAVAEGRARVVVGARSALFLPFPDLGLIVVDEEHDGAFKQDDGVCYQGRDMAVVRAHQGGLPVVLVSATPSLETVVNVERGRYHRLHLPTRHGAAELPDIAAIDLRRDAPPRGRWLAPTLKTAITETLADHAQALLFLNRRGYAPLTLCRACGHRLQCPNCTAWLVEHRLAGRLQCHHCGLAMDLPRHCPACDAEDRLVPCGPGVERLAEEVATDFPDARLAVATSDTLTGPTAAADLIRRIRDHEVDLVVATQVLAKGHNFPQLTLVGVVDADLGLGGADPRAGERTYQLLHQVAGRAGRGTRPGRVLLQTYDPTHPVMTALVDGGRDAFLAAEAREREDAGMPPYGRLATLTASSPDPERLDAYTHALARAAPQYADVAIWGPAPPPLALLRGRHRRRFLVKAPRRVDLQTVLRTWTQPVKVPSDVRVQIDVDPYTFL